MFPTRAMRLTMSGAAILVCLTLSGCGRDTSTQNIERVLKADATTVKGAKSVAEVVQRMRDIDLERCPQDFHAAYVAHIHAWEQLAEVEQDAIAFEREFNCLGAFVEAFIRGLAFDLGKGRECIAEENRIKRNQQLALTQIRITFHRVEEIAVAHRATLPKREAQVARK